MANRFDPTKDAVNREKHKLPLAFGDRLFEDDDHLVLPSFRVKDIFVWRDELPRFISVRRSNKGEEKSYRSSL